MEDLYSVRDVARIFGLQESRLRYWAQTGFVGPSVRREGRQLYSFQDLIAVKAAKELLDSGLSLQRVRRNLSALREALPHVSQPLAKLRVRSYGDSLVISDEGGSFVPESGQVVMEFAVGALSRQVAQILQLPAARAGHQEAGASRVAPADAGAAPPGVAGTARTGGTAGTAATAGTAELVGRAGTAGRGAAPAACCDGTSALSMLPRVPAEMPDRPTAVTPLPPPVEPPPSPEAAGSAYAAFLDGCRLEAAGAGDEEVRQAYEKAVGLDPSLAAALTNLGNLLHRRGELQSASEYYAQALALDPEQPEARFNLANLYLERGESELAIAELRRVLILSPSFADAHFNLATALLAVGSRVQAQAHLLRYLELDGDSEGPWATQARSLLGELEG